MITIGLSPIVVRIKAAGETVVRPRAGHLIGISLSDDNRWTVTLKCATNVATADIHTLTIAQPSIRIVVGAG